MNHNQSHSQPKSKLPNARKIRRSCNRELTRTVKRLKLWVPDEKFKTAEKLYVQRVIGNLIWVTENGSNRKKLADWFEEAIAPDIAIIWDVDSAKLSAAFRESFGG